VLDLSILVGLIFALAVVFLVALWYLWSTKWKGWRYVAAGGVALFGVLGLPIVWASVGKDDTDRVATPVPVRSALDVMIVTDGSAHPTPAGVPSDPALAGFDVRYSVGVAGGRHVRWTAANGTAGEALAAVARGRAAPSAEHMPMLRVGADAVLMLVVDGTAPVLDAPEKLPDVRVSDDEEERLTRWRGVARDVIRLVGDHEPPTPAFALLQTADEARIGVWTDPTSSVRPASVQGLASPTLTDTAVALAIQAPSARADFALAEEHRPALLFDDDEPVPKPLAIDALFRQGHVHLCDDRPLAGDGCSPDPIRDPRDLRNGGKRLELERPSSDALRAQARRERVRSRAAVVAPQSAMPAAGQQPASAPLTSSQPDAPLGEGGAIYVHPVSVNTGGQRLLYLDYWWYLSDNPARAAGGALCGAGLVIPGATCQDHESDWEGVTVVVDRTTATPVVTAVHYAQHNRVNRYDWKALRAYWRTPRLQRFAKRVTGADARPLVFVAEGTHASYPFPCSTDCKQIGAGLGENDHDGELEWGGNNTKNCGAANCLQPLPTAGGGQQAALWNDFSGPWGKPHCLWRYYCDSGSPPEAPGRQKRYRDPTLAAVHGGRVDR
jgi:hypothetical protein